MRRSFALSLILFAALASNVFAIGEARLAGKILDASGKPVPNATITVSTNKGRNFKQVYKAKSDGTYAIFLIDGTLPYDFLYEAPGFASYRENMKLRLGESNTKDITLNTANATAAAAAAASAPPAPTSDPAIAAYNEGASLYNAGKDAEAIAKFEQATAAKPDLVTAYAGAARSYYRMKNYPKAIENANKVIAVDSDDADMSLILANSYTLTGDKEKAAQFKSKLPVNPTSNFNEAAKAINAGKDAEAEPLLKDAIAADPKFAMAYYELGMIYVRTGKSADARTNLQQYLVLEPNGKDAATAKEMLKYVK
jgi:tetratricopeptide (TPR) repeat protein